MKCIKSLTQFENKNSSKIVKNNLKEGKIIILIVALNIFRYLKEKEKIYEKN